MRGVRRRARGKTVNVLPIASLGELSERLGDVLVGGTVATTPMNEEVHAPQTSDLHNLCLCHVNVNAQKEIASPLNNLEMSSWIVSFLIKDCQAVGTQTIPEGNHKDNHREKSRERHEETRYKAGPGNPRNKPSH